MPQDERPPEPWHSFLDELDAGVGKPTQLHCMGGFVVSLLYGFSRPTADIDVLAVIPRDSQARMGIATRGGPLHRKYNVYLDLVTIASVPDSYEARMVPMFSGIYHRLELFALDPYDLRFRNWKETFSVTEMMYCTYFVRYRSTLKSCDSGTRMNYVGNSAIPTEKT